MIITRVPWGPQGSKFNQNDSTISPKVFPCPKGPNLNSILYASRIPTSPLWSSAFTTPQHTPHHTTLHCTTPHHITPHHTTRHHIKSYHTTTPQVTKIKPKLTGRGRARVARRNSLTTWNHITPHHTTPQVTKINRKTYRQMQGQTSQTKCSRCVFQAEGMLAFFKWTTK